MNALTHGLVLLLWVGAQTPDGDGNGTKRSAPTGSTTSSTPAPRSPPTVIGPKRSTQRPSDQQATPSSTASTADEAERWSLDAIAAVRAAIKKTRSAECIFYKEEWKGGAELEPTRGVLKHRRGGDTFLAFESGPEAGRHILWRPKHNDGNLLVSNPMINLNLDPDGFIPMRNSRHSIRDAGMLSVAKRIMRDAARVMKEGGVVEYTNLGWRKFEGERTRCFGTTFDKKNHQKFFAARTEICVSEKTGLPVEVRVWQHEGGKLRRVGLYRYTRCEVNKLTDTDFDPANPAYKF